MKLSDIVEKLGGTLEGDGDIEITAVAGLSEAGEGDLSFLANPKYSAQVSTTKASAVIVPNDWERKEKCALVCKVFLDKFGRIRIYGNMSSRDSSGSNEKILSRIPAAVRFCQLSSPRS